MGGHVHVSLPRTKLGMANGLMQGQWAMGEDKRFSKMRIAWICHVILHWCCGDCKLEDE